MTIKSTKRRNNSVFWAVLAINTVAEFSRHANTYEKVKSKKDNIIVVPVGVATRK
jgi:hypothetical protein